MNTEITGFGNPSGFANTNANHDKNHVLVQEHMKIAWQIQDFWQNSLFIFLNKVSDKNNGKLYFLYN